MVAFRDVLSTTKNGAHRPASGILILETNGLLFEFVKHIMRELNITQTFFASVLRHLQEASAGQAKTLNIAIGEISELDPISIQTHWDELIKGTRAEQAEIHFRLIPAELQCMGCFQKYHPLNKKI